MILAILLKRKMNHGSTRMDTEAKRMRKNSSFTSKVKLNKYKCTDLEKNRGMEDWSGTKI
jgi:hypothetical protein